MTNTVAPAASLTRDQLGEQLAQVMQLGMLETAAVRIMVQGLPQGMFEQFREVLEDLAGVAQPGDDECLKNIFKDRESRREAIRVLMNYARACSGH